MNNPTQQQSPALRMEAGSINCIPLYALFYAANRNLLSVADSLPAHYFEYLLLLHLIILIHIIRRTPETTSVSYSNGEGNTVLTYDEGGQAKYANGRLTTVVDDAGKLELGYDIKGNRIYQKRKIDDLEIIFRREYDIQSRLASTTYPDGTKVYQKYATTGHFSGITMDTADGSSKGYTVGSYNGPVIENGQFKIIRETGNGVKMEIEYDPIKRRPKGLVTKLASGHIENAVAYTYDQKNNITQIADTIVNGRTQDFVYDAQNRLIKATGKYGTENYTYSDNGNLLQRGQFTLAYGDANHKHAVTSVTSPSTGTFNYSYDEAGNMISRNGDTMSYNSQGKLKQIDTEGGDKLNYLYDSTGNRIKKTSKTSGVVVYSFDGLYEIARTPGEGDKHTLYFKGLYGDIFSQMTRNDAQLVVSHGGTETQRLGGFGSWFNVCVDISGSCSQYYTNSIKYYWIKGVFEGYTVISRIEFRVGLWVMLIVMLYLLARILSKLSLSRNTGINEEKSQNSLFPLRLSASVATISILFTFTQCGIIGGGKKKGDAPWLLLASGVNSNTPSVDSPSNGNSSGGSGGSGGSSLVPVIGMYFLHPDHLGSITMITDGRGNVIAGGNNGGKSHISYKPYGEIHRTDSSGPDITRFKYTGQEEDKESGLMYYKARYYDPMIGRFLQADNEYNPDDTQGMNHYMYVNGSPMNFRDGSGNACAKQFYSQIPAAIGYRIGTYYGGMYGGIAGYSTGLAAFGIAPGHNFTGGGFGGRCDDTKPNKFGALMALFYKETGNGADLAKVYIIQRYIEMQAATGQPTILDGLNTHRKSYTIALIGLVVTGQILPEVAYFIYITMTTGVREPTNRIDRGSYEHDFSDGSTPPRHKAKASNNRWIRNAWRNAENPYDYAVALTGTILFKASNLIGDAFGVSRAKRTSHFSCEHCSIKFNGSY